MSTKIKFWIAGIIVAAAGLIIARVVAPMYSDQAPVQLGLFLLGVVVAMAGLTIFLLGIRKG